MMNNFYKNPLTKVYQYEYAIYTILSSYFKSVKCESNAIETLRLYYSELIKTNSNGHDSYEKQYEMEEEVERLIQKSLIGKITMPAIQDRDVHVTVTRNEDETHSFTFESGSYSFTYRLVLEEIEDKRPNSDKIQRPKKYKIFLELIGSKTPCGSKQNNRIGIVAIMHTKAGVSA